MRLVGSAGALSGIGLARASRSDRQLSATDPASYSVYASRSGLETKLARLGVLVANAVPATESFWKGAVALDPPKEAKGAWLSAVVWLREDRIVRVLVNVGDEKTLGELPKLLNGIYERPGSTKGTITTWTLADGTSARLDIGAAASLVVESAGTRIASPVDSGVSP